MSLHRHQSITDHAHPIRHHQHIGRGHKQGHGGNAEHVLPIALAKGGSPSESSASAKEVNGRVKGEERERGSYHRLFHLNVTHWGDAVDGVA